uniref:Angiogenic factor with G patch and FHA domains 1 n=1 Tax=Panagrolaimus superbus TaxID=310955 RepID=A0A914YVB4_9BILA
MYISSELEAQNPPCIRIIETHNAFRFHIMTIDGGTIGCARQCNVQLPDEGAIDEEHIRIFYDHQDPASDNITKGFWLRNQSRHAILVNETVVTRKKTVEINHGDIMLIGDNRLVFHIHKGMNTCNECEPGILAKEAEKQAAELKQTKRTSETARREFMVSMKRKYGLDRGHHVSSSSGAGEYSDRAKFRRKHVGSEIDLPSRSTGGTRSTTGGVYDECVARPAPGGGTGLVDTVELKAKPKRPVPTPITEENKGHKLLKLMGWSEGKGLGKSGQGTVDPLATQLKADRTGIGHEKAGGAAEPPKQRTTAKSRILEKTKQRFEQLGDNF